MNIFLIPILYGLTKVLAVIAIWGIVLLIILISMGINKVSAIVKHKH